MEYAAGRSNANFDHYLELKGKIMSFNSLVQNGDGDGAEEIPESAIVASLKFLELVGQFSQRIEPADAAPSPDGKIAFYWSYDNKYAEVSFDGAGTVTLCWKEGDDEMQLIEENDKIIFEDDWIDKSVVWKKLYPFLCREI